MTFAAGLLHLSTQSRNVSSVARAVACSYDSSLISQVFESLQPQNPQRSPEENLCPDSISSQNFVRISSAKSPNSTQMSLPGERAKYVLPMHEYPSGTPSTPYGSMHSAHVHLTSAVSGSILCPASLRIWSHCSTESSFSVSLLASGISVILSSFSRIVIGCFY